MKPLVVLSFSGFVKALYDDRLKERDVLDNMDKIAFFLRSPREWSMSTPAITVARALAEKLDFQFFTPEEALVVACIELARTIILETEKINHVVWLDLSSEDAVFKQLKSINDILIRTGLNPISSRGKEMSPAGAEMLLSDQYLLEIKIKRMNILKQGRKQEPAVRIIPSTF